MIAARSGNQYIDVSAITNENMEEPFVYLLQEYFGRPDLELAMPIQLAEPHVLVAAMPLVPNGIVSAEMHEACIGRRRGGRYVKSWKEVIRYDLEFLAFIEDMTLEAFRELGLE
ncbi:unnamed protein product [Cuscuta campestris]|uniref:Uncharacterized protein n=1 Tax=Cuscuta campestris TaxID=132261 RepID=A0A484MZ11_9ASTE|nr:unnamed protein product [Cuscuta campestris]